MANLIVAGGFVLGSGILLLVFAMVLIAEQRPIDRAVKAAEAALHRRGYQVIRGVVVRIK